MDLHSLSDELFKREERYSLAKKATLFGIWDWNITTGDLYWDDTMFELFQPANWNGKVEDFYNCLAVEDAVVAHKKLEACINSDAPYDYRYKVITKTGKQVYVRGRGNIVSRDEQGKPDRMIGICIKGED